MTEWGKAVNRALVGVNRKINFNMDYIDECDMKTIKTALEKQIPKKPSADSYGERGTGYIVPMCPTCQESVEEGEHHCKCGQSLDWSEVWQF